MPRSFPKAIRPRLLLIVHEAQDDLKPGEWKFMIMQSWASEHDLLSAKGPKVVEDMKERGRLYAEPFNAIFQSIPEDSLSWHKRLSYWPTEAWDNHNGTVTLIGDAAHPMTFRTSSTFLYALRHLSYLPGPLTSFFARSWSRAQQRDPRRSDTCQRAEEAGNCFAICGCFCPCCL
jgi:hypothetical protein